MYFVKYGNKYLHEPRVDELVLTDLEFEGHENEASLCTFEISCFHPLYDELVERASTKFVKVFDDSLGEDEPYFVGYIYEMSDEFNLQRTVKCKGELAFFNDSIVRPYTTQGNADVEADPGAYFEWLVEKHNEQVEQAKRFTLGTVQTSNLDINGYILRADYTYPTTGEVISKKLLDSLGGVLRVRYEGGKRYIDYLTEWSDVNTQVFDFGVNLTDYAKTDDALDVATFVIPTGANMKDTTYDYDDGYYVTSDTKPKENKKYYVRSFKKCGAMSSFTSGVTYYEKKQAEFKTSDTKPFSGVDYYLKVWKAQFTKSTAKTAFTEGKTYYEYTSAKGYFVTSDKKPASGKTYYLQIASFKSGTTYYQYSSENGYYKTSHAKPQKGVTYYTLKWEKQSISKFEDNKTYWERETYYTKTSDSSPLSSKDYYILNRGSYTSKNDLGRFLKYETYYEYRKADDESERKLTIEALPNIQYSSDIVKAGDMVYSEKAVEKYGWIGAVYANTDIKMRENLLNAGVLALKEVMSPATTIEVKAVDLALINPEHKPIRVGEYVRVRSKPHRFDSYMLCTGVKLNLNDPAKNEYTLGTTFDKLSGQQNARIKALNKTIEQVYEQAAAISDAAKEEALAAAEEANKAIADAIAANDYAGAAQDSIEDVVADAEEAKEQAEQAAQDAGVAYEKAEQAEQAVDSIVQLVVTTNRSTTLRNPDDVITATANVYKRGTKLTEEEVAAIGTVRWYVNGLPVENVTGTTCTINACTATLKARLEAN